MIRRVSHLQPPPDHGSGPSLCQQLTHHLDHYFFELALCGHVRWECLALSGHDNGYLLHSLTCTIHTHSEENRYV